MFQSQDPERGDIAGIQVDMEVTDQRAKPIGWVKEIYPRTFLLDRPGEPDVYVPLASAHLSGKRVQIDVTADEVDLQGWNQSDIVASPTE